MGENTEKYGLYLKWDKGVDKAVICLVQIANGLPKEQWYQHNADTRGIVTERAAEAIRQRIADLEAALRALVGERAGGLVYREAGYGRGWAYECAYCEADDIDLEQFAHKLNCPIAEARKALEDANPLT